MTGKANKSTAKNKKRRAYLTRVATRRSKPTPPFQSRSKPKSIKVEADSAELRALAAQQSNWRLARRILAIAQLAEGMSLETLAVRLRVDPDSLASWVKRFKRRGVEGLHGRENYHRPHRLNAKQMEQLKAFIIANPESTFTGLGRWVKTRFGVEYTLPGIMRIVKSVLGFTRENGKLTARTEAGIG